MSDPRQVNAELRRLAVGWEGDDAVLFAAADLLEQHAALVAAIEALKTTWLRAAALGPSDSEAVWAFTQCAEELAALLEPSR